MFWACAYCAAVNRLFLFILPTKLNVNFYEDNKNVGVLHDVAGSFCMCSSCVYRWFFCFGLGGFWGFSAVSYCWIEYGVSVCFVGGAVTSSSDRASGACDSEYRFSRRV